MPDGTAEGTMPTVEDDIKTVGAIEAVPTILEVVCRTTGMGLAAVARVTEGRWVACALLDNIHFGLKPGGELKVETTICHEIRQSEQAVVIDDVDQDVQYCNHPTPAMYGFKSYISVPITLADGSFFGTLCAIDPHPRPLKESGAPGMFKLFAQMIAHHLDAVRRVGEAEGQVLQANRRANAAEGRSQKAGRRAFEAEGKLADEQATALLREQFIAVLGHDLRNPLSAISGGVRLLVPELHTAKARQIAELVQASVVRMSGLIDNVLDFARGRLGGGLSLQRNAAEPLEPVLRQVIEELRIGVPNRVIETDYDITHPISADRARIGQLFSNLVGNALTHGAADAPVRVRAKSDGQDFELVVSNAGPQIDQTAMERLFQPFFRGEVRHSQQGLGLGLHIASEIAKAHGGTIAVSSTPSETQFTFQMPIDDRSEL